MELGDTYYFARCLPHSNEYEVLDLKIRTITDDYFVGLDCLQEKSSMQAFLFKKSMIDEEVFKHYEDAIDMVKEMKKLKRAEV